MIVKGNKEVSERYWGNKAIQYVYFGIKLVWSNIASCFGGGRWTNEQPWSNSDSWRNN